jgi:hypothetical protein
MRGIVREGGYSCPGQVSFLTRREAFFVPRLLRDSTVVLIVSAKIFKFYSYSRVQTTHFDSLPVRSLRPRHSPTSREAMPHICHTRHPLLLLACIITRDHDATILDFSCHTSFDTPIQHRPSGTTHKTTPCLLALLNNTFPLPLLPFQ